MCVIIKDDQNISNLWTKYNFLEKKLFYRICNRKFRLTVESIGPKFRLWILSNKIIILTGLDFNQQQFNLFYLHSIKRTSAAFNWQKQYLHCHVLPPTGKNRCITKNCTESLSNLGNGMFQMTILCIIDICGVTNRLIRYLWMLKSPAFCIIPFPRFLKMNKFNSFLPTFSKIKQNNFCLHFLKLYFSQKVCHFEQQHKIHIIRIVDIEFI